MSAEMHGPQLHGEKILRTPVSESARFVGFLQCSRQKERTEEEDGVKAKAFTRIKMNTKLSLKELQNMSRYEETPYDP